MIQKINFRDQVRAHILKKLQSGQLRLNDTLSLAELARELKVSTTPIREALSQLQYSKIIEAIPNSGFRVPPLDAQEAHNLYTLLATLEHMVVSQATYSSSTIQRLRKANDVFINSQSALERINADFKFHKELIAPSKNDYACQIITDIKTRIFFYEVEFMEDKDLQPLSNHHHQEIIAALENGDTKLAAEITRANWNLSQKKF